MLHRLLLPHSSLPPCSSSYFETFLLLSVNSYTCSGACVCSYVCIGRAGLVLTSEVVQAEHGSVLILPVPGVALQRTPVLFCLCPEQRWHHWTHVRSCDPE